ncbi:unnamed protein product [Nesidiocoris tenuis]|uniref:Uncharacterized protein n=1 Tax=Nesidiocoris tenuis TaxID=355587 RepID=A0A6H5GIJ5_9HEMI|nr:unnamed protein product [Nesidiocoris tenuis]
MPRRAFASVPRLAFASVPRRAFASVPRPTFASVPVWSDKGKQSSCQVLISYRFQGYGCQKTPKDHPMYMTTTYLTYGYFPPTMETVPKSYYPLSQKFTESISNFGVYRNHSLNI